MPAKHPHVCFVGQGPNMTSWHAGVRYCDERGLVGDRRDEFMRRRNVRLALTGQVGQKLARLMGEDHLRFLINYRRENLNAHFMGKASKGDLFDKIEGREAARRLLWDSSILKFVLLGQNVAECFGFKNPEPLTTQVDGLLFANLAREFFFLPHPSGVNIWWNDPGNKRRAARALRKFVHD